MLKRLAVYAVEQEIV